MLGVGQGCKRIGGKADVDQLKVEGRYLECQSKEIGFCNIDNR